MLKDSDHEPIIKWSVADQPTAFLCLTEKLAILLAEKQTALNKGSELMLRRNCLYQLICILL